MVQIPYVFVNLESPLYFTDNTYPKTVSALETFFLAMALYPEAQRTAHAEIDAVLGDSRLPDFSDEEKLPYVGAVLKEVLRWHPVVPLGG